MSAEDRALPATLAGIPLLCKVIGGEDGRRTTTVEFPGRDLPASQDHGRSASRWSIEGVFVGPDYDIDLQRLRAAMREPGPYAFVHPIAGSVSVVAASAFRWSLDLVNGIGSATWSITLAEAGDVEETIVILASTAADLTDASVALTTATIAAFEAGWVATAGATWARAVGSATLALARVGAINGRIKAKIGGIDAATALVEDATAAVEALAATPGELAASIASAVGAALGVIRLAEVSSDPDDTVAAGERGRALVAAIRDAVTWAPDLADAPPTADAEQNDAAITGALALLTIAAAADVLAVLTIDATDTAAEILEVALEGLDAEAEATWTSDALFDAIADTRAAIDARLEELTAELPARASVEVTDTVPALIHAWRIYGDIDREAEIVARNDPPDPAAVAPGATLEVLL